MLSNIRKLISIAAIFPIGLTPIYGYAGDATHYHYGIENHIVAQPPVVGAVLNSLGDWITQQIVVTDQVGNERYEDLDDYGFKLLINNQEVDQIAPEYVKKSMQLFVNTVQKEGRSVFNQFCISSTIGNPDLVPSIFTEANKSHKKEITDIINAFSSMGVFLCTPKQKKIMLEKVQYINT